MINRLYAHRHYPNLEPEYATVIKMVMTTVRRLQLMMIELMMMMQMMTMMMMTMTVCASDFTSSLVHMVRALVEVPHVRIVSLSQLKELAALLDRCPKSRSRSMRVDRRTYHFRFGHRWVSLFSVSQLLTHLSLIMTVSGCFPSRKHCTR